MVRQSFGARFKAGLGCGRRVVRGARDNDMRRVAGRKWRGGRRGDFREPGGLSAQHDAAMEIGIDHSRKEAGRTASFLAY